MVAGAAAAAAQPSASAVEEGKKGSGNGAPSATAENAVEKKQASTDGAAA